MKIKKLYAVPNLQDRKDIDELGQKIEAFQAGNIDEERFKHFRLTRGVYGQRQTGVHMFRTKLPLGRITPDQLIRLAEVSERYATGNLHLTTRQDIQYHYVKLDDATKIWTELSGDGINAREACGNTVRNITASSKAGIDPHEPFDVSPYAHAMYRYFLRNAICQEMGRKIKIAFSSSEFDTAYAYFHDFGFIPRIKNGRKGFRLVVGGGLGAQSMVAQQAFDFIDANRIIPFTEAAIRVFDRHGEREKRFKARMKFLLKKWGLETFLEHVENEMTALPYQVFPIDEGKWPKPALPLVNPGNQHEEISELFNRWKRTNTWKQKQDGFYAVGIKIRLGDISSKRAIQLAEIIKRHASNDIRLTVNQSILLRFVRPQSLPALYSDLKAINLADPGFESITDITACPGTDTCNLGVTNSTALSNELEQVIESEYAELVEEKDIQIKISGCMNACGQHMAAQIGFHGSSIKVDGKILPAMQVILGGGIEPSGKTYIGEKVIKLPTKRIPQAVRVILDHYEQKADRDELFNGFYYALGKKYFYDLLKPLAQTEEVQTDEFLDWGSNQDYIQAIGVGECAGASVDVVATIFGDAFDRLSKAETSLQAKEWAAAIYNSYSAYVISAKALLLAEDIRCNSHQGIIDDFQANFAAAGKLSDSIDFVKSVNRISEKQPSAEFAREYHLDSRSFYEKCLAYRSSQLIELGMDKRVVINHYKA